MNRELTEIDMIASHAKIKEILTRYQLTARKNFGQNFLVDAHVVRKIMKASDVTKEDLVIEIGPGIGSLTQCLAMEAKKVLAIEIDKNMVEVLKETLAAHSNVEVIHADILKFDLANAWQADEYRAVKVVANLPYYITTAIIMKFLESNLGVDTITVMVQKEVAERMRASHSTKEYGSLSIAVQYYAEIDLVANVPRNCFIPRPNIDSAVIRLQKRTQPPVYTESEDLMFRLIKIAFSSRRKTLVNCMFHAQELLLSKEELIALLGQFGIDEKIRGENLTVEQFASLANELKIRGY